MAVTAVLNMNEDRSGDGYMGLLECIRKHFLAMAVRDKRPLFTTNATNLFDIFLDHLPDEARQHYTCNACRKFVNRYGGLVTIEPDGTTIPVMWDTDAVPWFFKQAIASVEYFVQQARVNGVFFSDKDCWGTPVTGEWYHMAVLPADLVFRSRTKTARQAMAEKREDCKMLFAGLRDFPLASVDQAVKILQVDALYRSEKVLGVAEWLKGLHERREATKNLAHRSNLTWLAAATAPIGFCHIRSSMIGTLLTDIVDGLSFDEVSRRFAKKMHPLKYQRPQSAPAVGNRAQAEKLVEQLGIEASLARRFARIDEIKKVWEPTAAREKPVQGSDGGGVFAHVRTKNSAAPVEDLDVPPQTITWCKFRDTVLPTAYEIEYLVQRRPAFFTALVTAENADAPPILQWDSEEQRNPVSWYVYHGGSSPQQWGLEPGYCRVTAVTLGPSMWNGGFAHQGKGVVFVLQGAKDTYYQNAGIALFPEILKSDFHAVRKTIESFSKTKQLGGYEEASACGISLSAARDWNVVVRVTTVAGKVKYKLDRWD